MVPKPARRSRVWLLTNAPSPYQAELFTAIADRNDVDLHVRFMRGLSSSGVAVSSQFSNQVLLGLGPSRLRDEVRLHPRALWEATFGTFDCYILSGLYTSVTFQLCWLMVRLRRKPLVVWLERPRQPPDAGKGGWRRAVGTIRRWTLRGARKVWAIGSLAQQEYAAILGGKSEPLMLPYCCDTERYRDVHRDDIARVRDGLGLPDPFVFLFAGQLIPRKGVRLLLAAFAQVAAKRERATLVILGDGPLRRTLEDEVPHEIRSRVHFTGHVDQRRLPAYFRAADAFVFPSRHDGWGVVINEACAAGLPIIATPQVGAVHDLVRDGENGSVVDRDDVDGFARQMTFLLDHPETARAQGEVSKALVEPFSARNGAARFGEHVRTTLSTAN